MESLLEDENAKDYIGKFDVVLQNPPFAGSIDKNSINSKLLTLTNTKKTELLFIMYVFMNRIVIIRIHFFCVLERSRA